MNARGYFLAIYYQYIDIIILIVISGLIFDNKKITHKQLGSLILYQLNISTSFLVGFDNFFQLLAVAISKSESPRLFVEKILWLPK